MHTLGGVLRGIFARGKSHSGHRGYGGVLVFHGDSTTVGNGASGPTHYYPAVVAAALAAYGTYTATNSGSSGQTLAQMQTSALTVVDPHYDASKKQNLLFVWGGTNDIYFGASGQTAHNRLVAYCQARQAIGWQMIVLTMLPRSNSGTPGTFEADRQTFNTLVRAHVLNFADVLADVAGDTRIGDAGDETDATYYADLVHPTDAGYQIVADIATAAAVTL